jgi:hypothetical protein
MQQLQQYWIAQALEKDLGDPNHPDSIMSFKTTIALDEQETFPEKEIEWLYRTHLGAL